MYSLAESEEITARQMEPDIREVDTLKRSLKELQREISLLQSKLHGIGKNLSKPFYNVNSFEI